MLRAKNGCAGTKEKSGSSAGLHSNNAIRKFTDLPRFETDAAVKILVSKSSKKLICESAAIHLPKWRHSVIVTIIMIKNLIPPKAYRNTRCLPHDSAVNINKPKL
jgi:hypothetical protein